LSANAGAKVNYACISLALKGWPKFHRFSGQFSVQYWCKISYHNICLILHLCFQNSELKLQSKANVTVNARSSGGNITGQLFVGNDEVVARNQKFSIKTDQGKNILYADKDKIHFAADKLEFLSNYY